MAYNEEANISTLLQSLLNQNLSACTINEILVISSGSSDNTEKIVKQFSEKDSRVKLIIQKERLGKASAINCFLKNAKNKINILVNGDSILDKNAIELLVNPFIDLNVGMTAGHSFPINSADTFIRYLNHFLWKLHHKISLRLPKMGELVAFRKDVVEEIPVQTAVDEVCLEAAIKKKSYRLVYVSGAKVSIRTPETIRDFIRQRRRIANGHIWAEKNLHYTPSTRKKWLTLKLALKELNWNPKVIFFTLGAIFLECLSRFLGMFDYYIKRKNPYIWEVVESTKHKLRGNLPFMKSYFPKINIANNIDFKFSNIETPGLRELVKSDLTKIVSFINREFRHAIVLLGGSYAFGEAAVFVNNRKLVSFSDYDIFILINSSNPIIIFKAIRKFFCLKNNFLELNCYLNNRNIDINILFRPLVLNSWQRAYPAKVLWGNKNEYGKLINRIKINGNLRNKFKKDFIFFSIRECLDLLIRTTPSKISEKKYIVDVYNLNRCILNIMRLYCNIMSEKDIIYSFGESYKFIQLEFSNAIQKEALDEFKYSFEENVELEIKRLHHNSYDSLFKNKDELYIRWFKIRQILFSFTFINNFLDSKQPVPNRFLIQEFKIYIQYILKCLSFKKIPNLFINPAVLMTKAKVDIIKCILQNKEINSRLLDRVEKNLSKLVLKKRAFTNEKEKFEWCLQNVNFSKWSNPLRLLVNQ